MAVSCCRRRCAPDFDRTRLAFEQVERGEDEPARETLQGIGLRSPFLEWKLLLRGLQAYYLKDDARALENWQRLNPARLPARLAAPFRCRFDAAYRAAQPAAVQGLLQTQFDQMQGTRTRRKLRELRPALANRESMAPAFRQVEGLLPQLRRTPPNYCRASRRAFTGRS